MKDDLTADFNVIMDELEKNPEFLPSKFWRTVNAKNIAMLKAEGLENLKRTVSQNYYNWLITWPWDPQFKSALWSWVRKPSLRLFEGSIERPLSIRLITGDNSIILSARARFFYRIFVSLIWTKLVEFDQHHLSEQVSEPEIGNPIRIRQANRLISQDLVNSIIECNVIADLIKDLPHSPRVAEIGAGYGRLGHVYAATQPGTYFIFDIPPALQVAEYYLTHVFPEKKIFEFRRWETFDEVKDEFDNSDIVFLSANQLTKFPPRYFDVITTISTLPEMTKDQVKLYLGEFDRLGKSHIFLKQWNTWTNRLDKMTLSSNDYSPGPNWVLSMDRRDPINPRFFNQVWSRSETTH